MRERAQVYLDDPTLVKNIIADGVKRRANTPARPCAMCVNPWVWNTTDV
jgi:hypothetical protein